MISAGKRWIGCLIALAWAGMAAGNGITLEQVETAVGNWAVRGGAFGKFASGTAVSGETFENPDTGAKLHVVHVPGKGFAVTSTDDGIEPIILFSDGDGEFVPEFIPLGVALDDDTFAFSSEGVAEWMGQTAESHDGVDAARCAIEMSSGTNYWATASLKTSVTGPGRLSFWWKGAGNYGDAELRVDNQYAMSLSVTNRIWEEVHWDFAGTATHEVEWVLQRYNHSSSPYYNATGWVDQVTWTPEEAMPLATALDNDELAFSSDGDESWMGQRGESHDGVDAARCAIEKPCGTNVLAEASLKTSVRGPGRLAFWWKGAGNYGNVELRVDNQYAMSLSVTNRDWEEVHWDFAGAAEHKVEWVLQRYNHSSSPYYNATGWVDQVTWTPEEVVPLATALDNDELTFSSSGDESWLGQRSESHDGVDAARCAIEKPSGTNYWAEANLKTSVTGPGRLSFWWKGAGNDGNIGLRVDNGLVMTRSVTNRTWEEVHWAFAGAAEHKVEWFLDRSNISGPFYNTTGWVDQVTWTPETIIPLATALDNDTLTFSSEGTESWLGQLAESHDGVDAARCVIEKSYGTNYWVEANLKTSVTGPGRLSFWWKGEGNSGNAELRVDNGLAMKLSLTNRVWEEARWDFADTSLHTVEWVLQRFNYDNATGWVDQVTWTPGSLVTFDASFRSVLGFQGEALPNLYEIPTRRAYTFGGYYDGPNGSGTQYYTATGESLGTWDKSGDATLYAKWIPATYTVTLDRQGGEGGSLSVMATYGERLPSITVPTREGYDFGGYYLGDGGGAHYSDCYYNAAGVGVEDWYLTSNVVLTAHWYEKADITWSYRIEDGKAIVTGASPAQGCLEIPARLGGCPVGAIGDSAFASALDLTGIIIPIGVEKIGLHAFQGCYNLALVTIPEGVKTIDSDAFMGSCFASIYIPSSLEEIGLGCNGSTIGSSALSVIEVAPGNGVYASEDGVLFSKDKSTLWQVPCMRTGEYEIPAGVTGINPYAFAYCNLTSATIPDSVTWIGYRAFEWCDRLNSITIPDSVTSMAYDVFSSALKRLEVPGAWWGTDKVVHSGVSSNCEVVYRGINPLAVVTETLPTGMVGAAYRATLEATGGIAPYTWNKTPGAYSETSAEGSFAETGTAQGWQADDSCWDLALPFAFPYFGHSYTNAKVNSNGTISFGTESVTQYWYDEILFKATPIIAVLWKYYRTTVGDIYVATESDAVTIRWQGMDYDRNDPMNVSATLKKDGTIVLKYGAGNWLGGGIGISAGDGVTALFSAKSLSGSMENAPDIVLQPVDERLPPGLSLTEDGVIQGMPTAVGEFAFTVVATDAKGMTATKRLVLSVNPVKTTETTPVGVPWNWLEQKASDILAAHCGDYEAAANAPAANGRPVWTCYVAGLSTTEVEAKFKVKSIALVDGEVQIEWNPDLNDNGATTERRYIVEGKQSMADEWGAKVPESRFFRVKVQLPEP